MNFQAEIYGDFSVKFRFMGHDLGAVKRSISLTNAVRFSLPYRLPAPFQLKFDKFGVKLDAWLAPI